MPYTKWVVKSNTNRPIKVLHVGVGMIKGGIEAWMMQVLSRNNPEQIQMDFVVHTTDPCPYDDEVRALGSRLIPCPYTSNFWLYGRHFQRILENYGPYDIVHSHVHYFNGYVLRLAKQAGIPIRIAHSHCDFTPIEVQASLSRRLYLALTRRWIQQYATLGLGGSQRSMVDLFGAGWESDARWQMLPYGVDLKPFRESVDPGTVRRELGIPQGAWVMGHVGRFVEQKNHSFLIDVAAEVIRREPKAHLLLIGDGKLQPAMRQKVQRLGITDRVTFTGIRSDVPRLMLGAMNGFLFPSLGEGLGFVLLEAQAAGLPCVFTEDIPTEVDVIPALVHRLSLSQSPAQWAEVLLSHWQQKPLSQPEALSILESSSFNDERSFRQLQTIYQTEYVRVTAKDGTNDPLRQTPNLVNF
ncbi:glycosyltransferase [Egbenema bharatensis]|uniref:glycosyltransferase n=1 Tax=Egbenema bharatensis TaxID=3463334 RepID=UPI003A89172B